jgi:uncharacterized protein YukE
VDGFAVPLDLLADAATATAAVAAALRGTDLAGPVAALAAALPGGAAAGAATATAPGWTAAVDGLAGAVDGHGHRLGAAAAAYAGADDAVVGALRRTGG